MGRIVIDAPVKINLALHVVGQRADGYHLLDSLVTFSEKGDRICVEDASRDAFFMDGFYAKDLSGENDNLVIKARDLLRDVACLSPADYPVSIRLTKNIPVSSGVGGGSADAAATLFALIELWQVSIDRRVLYQLALNLGADVPMCLHGLIEKSPVIAHGIGEEIEQFSSFPALDIVLVNPGIRVYTKDVFSRLLSRENPRLSFSRDNAFSYEELIKALALTRNDLYIPAVHMFPHLEELINGLVQTGAHFVRMSGSGATCFAIFPNSVEALKAEKEIRLQYPDYFVMSAKTLGKI